MFIPLIAIAWMYVVLMMSLAEGMSPQGTVVGAVITLGLYGLLPLSILVYILATPMRRKLREAQQAQAERQAPEASAEAPDAGSQAPAVAQATAVAPVREEVGVVADGAPRP